MADPFEITVFRDAITASAISMGATDTARFSFPTGTAGSNPYLAITNPG